MGETEKSLKICRVLLTFGAYFAAKRGLSAVALEAVPILEADAVVLARTPVALAHAAGEGEEAWLVHGVSVQVQQVSIYGKCPHAAHEAVHLARVGADHDLVVQEEALVPLREQQQRVVQVAVVPLGHEQLFVWFRRL